MEPFEGLSPNETLHQGYADFHSQTAIITRGSSRLQVNILLKANGLDRRIQKDIILPIMWIEENIDDIPQHIKNFMHFYGFVITKLFVILRYSLIVTLALILLLIYRDSQ